MFKGFTLYLEHQKLLRWRHRRCSRPWNLGLVDFFIRGEYRERQPGGPRDRWKRLGWQRIRLWAVDGNENSFLASINNFYFIFWFPKFVHGLIRIRIKYHMSRLLKFFKCCLFYTWQRSIYQRKLTLRKQLTFGFG